ncbi:hypothetical protein O181_084247 [Austropuccinia psidii MF-1]|uniref:RING-type E3 ubiquitin transferase n=1 Tax=Austropuccinia psidii MF-1 TaxID=1389203 RepID=A0A9Q3FVX4_9BASI|nr:hypothetical protein [Austropuccinia psidii MF-1]
MTQTKGNDENLVPSASTSNPSSQNDSSPTSSARLSPTQQREWLKIWSKNFDYPAAAQPEIIRADQKDEFFIESLKNQLEPLMRNIKGARWANTHSSQLLEASHLIYLFLTTWPGSQTLGEEYCDITQLDSSTKQAPLIFKRTFLIFLQVFSFRILKNLYDYLRQKLPSLTESHDLNNENYNQNLPQAPTTFQHLKMKFLTLLNYLPLTLNRTALNSLSLLHLTVFYLMGKYFSWSKRFLGIRYVSTRLRPLRPDGNGRVVPPSYEILGLLMSIQLIMKLVDQWKTFQSRREQLRLASEPVSDSKQKQKEKRIVKHIPTVDGRLIDEVIQEPESDDETGTDEHSQSEEIAEEDCPEGVTTEGVSDLMASRRCTLCLGPKKNQSSLECGHVFCWKCVVSWVKEKSECPLCRHSVRIADLLPLYNF